MNTWSDAEKAIQNASLERRRAVMRDYLRDVGAEVLIAYGHGLHSFTGTNPAWYLTSYKQIGPHAALILPLQDEPLLVITPEWDRERCLECVDIEVIAVEPSVFFETIGAQLKARNLAGRKTALAAGQQQPQEARAAWEPLLDQTPISAEKWINDTAKIRDEWALVCVRKAVAAAEAGYEHLLKTAHPGMPEYVVAGNVEMEMRRHGAEDNFQLLSASRHNYAGHFPTARKLALGDIILGEISPAIGGEFVQICRSSVVGEATETQKEKFALLDTALRAGMAAAKPGTPVGEVVDAISAPISAAGYEKYTKPPYMRTRGHSMGLGSLEPELMPGHDYILQKNMVFVMHPNQYIPETGYLMCGEPVIITDEGAKPLTKKMGTLASVGQ